jgi:hypothetical protein
MQESALYLEADEDITSAIDKLSRSSSKSVQIVVPKRSTMLQSIINLKLLKKAAENNGKELVLVTGDRIATELAGRVGLAVASSLGGKAVMAEKVEKPEDLDKGEEVIEAGDPPPPEPEPEPAVPKPAKKPLLSRRAVAEPPAPEPESDTEAGPGAAPTKKHPKVPNFNRLQRRAMWLGFGGVLIVGYLLAMYLFTSAKVTLYVNGNKVAIDTSFAVDPAAKTSDPSKAVLAGQSVSVSKDLSSTLTPTGQKDEGTPATGTMTVYNCNDANSHALQSGTRFAAPDGKIFKTNSDVSVPGATIGSSGACPNGGGFINPGSATVDVTADQNGDSYNEAAAKYSIVAYQGGSLAGTIFGKGGQMSGGTTKTVTVVQQSDVDGAKAALLAKDKDNMGRDLQGKVPSGYTLLPASENTNVTGTNPSPAVGSEGSSGNLKISVTYTALAVKQSDYEALVKAQELKQIGADNEIYDDGIAEAQVTASDKDAAGRPAFHFTTEAYGGKQIDHTDLAKKLAGKRYSDASDLATGLPGVTKADISVWPGWASSLPARASNITVAVKVAGKQ